MLCNLVIGNKTQLNEFVCLRFGDLEFGFLLLVDLEISAYIEHVFEQKC